MPSSEIRKRFLSFFEKRGHAVIPSASLLPSDVSETEKTLFVGAGMQPLIPYLLGRPHPEGTRLVDIQKCVRTGDIDDVGDNRHLTFFEMMGNWSLGDYFKKDAIAWSYELLTSKEEGFGLDPNRLYVTVFEGDANAPKDEEAIAIWKSIGILESRIYPLPAEDNWWSPGPNGPCGPDSEMFYDLTEKGLGELTKEEFIAAVKREDLFEIWNDVFMEYEAKDGKIIGKLAKQNVDTGSGLERTAVVLQGKRHVYETDLFVPIIEEIRKQSNTSDERAEKIIADHVRAATFMISEGVIPSNTERGYVLRRLLRLAIRYADSLGMGKGGLVAVANVIIENYGGIYPELAESAESIRQHINEEDEKFRRTIHEGLKKAGQGMDAFTLFTTYGLPFEMTDSLAVAAGRPRPDHAEFKRKLQEHQEASRTASAGMFKGGLAGDSEKILRLHTATHLLNAALKKALGPNVKQKGSNITEERLRFDFSHDAKMTDEQKKAVEDLVNGWIKEDLPVVRQEMPKEEAEKLGAEMEFGAKYPDTVSVYTIGDQNAPVSREFCGGPHVTHTGELGIFTIAKEEASSAGVRRIKAVLQ